MSLTTPDKIRRLQRKLYTKAKQEPGFRFYQLYDKVYREDILRHAWELSRRNGGAPGVDGVSFAAIETAGLEEWLARLGKELHDKTYEPAPVRRVMIPKPGGGERPLGIPTIRDRVAQTAAKLVLEPIFEAAFQARIVNYADDFVILSRGHATDALAWTRWGMAHMGLELSATKTRICNARQHCFDFLGYTFGPAHFRKDGRRYLAAQPSRRAVQRLKDKVHAALRAGIVAPWEEVRDPLNRLLRGWSSYFNYGTRTLAYRAVDSFVLTAVQNFLQRRHKVPGRGTRRFPHTLIFGELGVLRLRTVQLGRPATADA